ncbi:M1 family aminopeptidase [Mucilaginibacter sp. RS28]|uniref:Aminopeptidase N n=1 Tax=Mucilaginibacter straminoryzae TaxID=2932774 RepID=A0A9X2BAV9_9SPHI|nr:M1 family aminopeptidase [Mucilaginibacter straminoryzae]MCJ8211816.1 M1 family aminopeptidase [Mucilaginibacter straminoryzae]
MNKKYISYLLSLITAISAESVLAQVKSALPVETGVSLKLAEYRHSVITNVKYDLNFLIPADKTALLKASESLTFSIKSNIQLLQIDFKQPAERISSLWVNGKRADVNMWNEHLLIDQRLLHVGNNKIDIQFLTGDQTLNRNSDYLYELNVPDRARTVFPCFDQPDLKAIFTLTLTVPNEWNVLANATVKDSSKVADQKTIRFNPSDKLSTYLFSFAAGQFKAVTQNVGKRKAAFLYRETDQKKIKLSVDSVFIAHEHAINFLEQWTGIPFPFQKIGFVAIPDFQFGGMEHPGEVQYQSSTLFLDDAATKDRFISRNNLISHETAHMWFGDLVTMRWFNDVWMKEVFANFMADKVTEKVMGPETFGLKFLQDHYPAAYGIDRTEGANPIRQQLDNLKDAGSMYGNIIYHKAPIMMRQLELLMGKEKFRQGIQEYLKKYAYGNATWPDLIAILSKHTTANLYQWNKVWVNQPGRPVFDYDVDYANDKISGFTISQKPEYGEKRLWSQFFNIALVYPGEVKEITVNMTTEKAELKQAIGLAKPLFILFNTNGIGYGVFPVDKNISGSLYTIKSPLQRASLYISMYENMLSERYFKPNDLLTLFTEGLQNEKEETNLRLLTGYISNMYWTFITKSAREKLSPALESKLWQAMENQTATNNKKILFSTYQNVYLSPQASANMYQIWKTQQAPTGVKLNEDDYTGLALSIALRSDTVTNVLTEQMQRISNPDRKKRLEFLMPALSSKTAERDAFFNGLQDKKNRAKEAWVTAALSYLHHPLRQQTSEKYLPKSLELLEEIQQTGDIFFPQNWLNAIWGNYQDQYAVDVVRDFLKKHPDYNPKLKAKILQAADNSFRAVKLVKE